MWHKYGITIALFVGLLLTGWFAVSYHLYAEGGSHAAGNEKMGHDKTQSEAKKAEKTVSSDQLIKQADEWLARLEKAKNDKTLKEQCQKEIMALSYKMIQSAQEAIAICNAMLKEEKPDIQKIIDLANQSNELLKKSLEMMPQGCIIVSADKKDTSSKDQYVCPMECVPPVDKPGKCPECGMNLEKKK